MSEGSTINRGDLALIRDAAREAGEIALKFFKSDNQVWMKGGNSPVSEADHAVNDHLMHRLRKERPDYGWLSEETTDQADRHDRSRVFIVDPIDGTRGFINGSNEWCISIAVVEQSVPVASTLVCPALNQVWCAAAGSGATMNETAVTPSEPGANLRATGSRKLIEQMGASDVDFAVVDFVPSLALRLARVANGELDVAFARPGAHEWDIAAADLILREAGGVLTDTKGAMPAYNQRKLTSSSLVACKAGQEKHLITLAKKAGLLQ